MTSYSKIIGREISLFKNEMLQYQGELQSVVSGSSFLVLGAAGTIGQAVVKELFKLHPAKLHVVDISENNLVELVRDLRSSLGYISGEFKTFVLDIGSAEYDAFIRSDGEYQYVLNLSALKHVRSEKDPFTLMRMLQVNIFNTKKSLIHTIENGGTKYFAVSTDKASNPVNLMGASKSIMEQFLFYYSQELPISSARFANVAFSDGSLLHGFLQRHYKKQPIVVPSDIKRYFLLPEEAGQLCLLACLLGENREIFFPKLTNKLPLIPLQDIATKFVQEMNYEPYWCESEEEARGFFNSNKNDSYWPCLLSTSDTSGEKPFEEFFGSEDEVNNAKFENIGVIKNPPCQNDGRFELFENRIAEALQSLSWTKEQLIEIMNDFYPELRHSDKGKYLDSKM